MNSKILFMTLLVILQFAFSPAMISKQALVSGEAHAQAEIKIAVLDKMAKAQSARRFNYLYPKLTRYLRECFSKDGRFDLISPQEVGEAIKSAGIEEDGQGQTWSSSATTTRWEATLCRCTPIMSWLLCG